MYLITCVLTIDKVPEDENKSKDYRKSEEISSSVLPHLHQQPAPSYGQPPVPVAKLGVQQSAPSQPAPSKSTSVHYCLYFCNSKQPRVPQKTQASAKQQKSLVIRKVKEVKPDDLAKIYFG